MAHFVAEEFLVAEIDSKAAFFLVFLLCVTNFLDFYGVDHEIWVYVLNYFTYAVRISESLNIPLHLLLFEVVGKDFILCDYVELCLFGDYF